MLFFYQTRESQRSQNRDGLKINLERQNNNIYQEANKMTGIIAVAGIAVVSGILTYEFEAKVAPKEDK